MRIFLGEKRVLLVTSKDVLKSDLIFSEYDDILILPSVVLTEDERDFLISRIHRTL